LSIRSREGRTAADPGHENVSANHRADGVQAQADPAGRLCGDGHVNIHIDNLWAESEDTGVVTMTYLDRQGRGG
jgi:hypothetical protein